MDQRVMDANFDAEKLAEVVFDTKTNQIGYRWPVTWMGAIVFLEEFEDNELLENIDCLFDDDPRFNEFQKVCDL